jgi:hypothetical protein
MLKAGSIILTIWGGFNFALASAILVAVGIFQKNAPILFIVWCALVKRQQWAFWALFLGVGLAQTMGFVADAAIGTKTLIPNLALTVLFGVGIGLAGYGMFRSESTR